MCEVLLVRRWKLDFKRSSMKVYSGRRSEKYCNCRAFEWQMPFLVLGSLIGPEGSAAFDFEAASLAAWKRLWAGAASVRARGLSVKTKCIDIQRVCWPAVYS